MKQITVILFIALVLGPSLSRTWILLDFKIHQDFIAEVLCINRDIPQVMCNGNCYLTQQLEENEQQEETPFSAAQTIKLTYILPKTVRNILLTQQPSFSNFICKRSFRVSAYYDRVFRPPIFA